MSAGGSLGERYARHNLARGRGFIYGGGDRVRELRRAIGPMPSGRILDLGCRDGSLAGALELPPARTVGADIDELALRGADGRLRPCVTDLWKAFPFRSESFDLVVAGEVVEHVPFPDVFIAEAARVLRSGGRVVGSVPNSFRLKNRLTFLRGRWFEIDSTHLRQFSPTMLRALLSSRFARVEIHPCVGRLSPLWPRMFGNDLVWVAHKDERKVAHEAERS
jgi:2-polyprenyl-3-methyl-5-hydroxy-6-metoxy-1,4-benzoquinol methylase